MVSIGLSNGGIAGITAGMRHVPFLHELSSKSFNTSCNQLWPFNYLATEKKIAITRNFIRTRPHPSLLLPLTPVGLTGSDTRN